MEQLLEVRITCIFVVNEYLHGTNYKMLLWLWETLSEYDNLWLKTVKCFFIGDNVDGYFLTRLPVVEEQLSKGGVRLSNILNQALGQRNQLDIIPSWRVLHHLFMVSVDRIIICNVYPQIPPLIVKA